MPELPEVETTRRGVLPNVANLKITDIWQSHMNLRQPLEAITGQQLLNHAIQDIYRRGKYLIAKTSHPHLDLLIHLGMSGSLRINSEAEPRKKHDHIVFSFTNNQQLRYHDPRRFGFIKTINRGQPVKELAHLGFEPLDENFNAQTLFKLSRGRKRAIKTLIMDQSIVVGIGNIYATEALFTSGIHPEMPAKWLSHAQAQHLSDNIKKVLLAAIAAGGTTLRDFVHSDGTAGYFKQTLQIYGQANQPCPICSQPIESKVIGGRQSCYCPYCQSMPKKPGD
ncbi:MAG: formamidopyrimidine-DNA glycosylase [Cardiobacteriales bacterium]|nr:MAG: formamidopyrimidine-DNA glycosylase [Cardiobacteriales bacterium]